MVNDSFAAIDAALDRLPRTDWTVFRQVPWPGRPQVTVDHVVVGPAGVFVIEGDTSPGRVAVKNGQLRVNRRRRRSTTAAPAAAAVAIGERLATLDVRHVHGLVCFVRDEELGARAGQVLIGSTATLDKQLLAQPAYFSPARAHTIADDVETAMEAVESPDDWNRRRITGVHRERSAEHLRGRGSRTGSLVLATAGTMVAMFALVLMASLWTLFSSITDTSPAAAQDTGVACERVNANHPHGVGLPGARDRIEKGERRVKKYTVGKRLYRELRDLDTDDDGIACEKR